jgi:hypothetical protein
MVVPIQIMIQPGSDTESVPKRNIKAVKRPSLVKNYARLVNGNINHRGIGGKYLQNAIIRNDLLLRGALQIAKRKGLGTKTLNRIHDILRLIEERLAQRSRPIQARIHHTQHIGISRYRFDALIPGLEINLIQIVSTGYVPVRKNDLGGQCRRRKYLGNQRVGI